MNEFYISKRNSKDFIAFLTKMESFGITFTEDEDNGIFTKSGVSHPFAKRLLYRESGVARI